MADGAPQAAVKKRMLRIASGCATREAFISVFKRFCDRDAIFIATRTPKPAGADLQFAITLADGAPLIGGAGTVLESWSDETSPYGRAGMRIRFDDVTPSGRALIDELVAARRSEEQSEPAISIPSAAAALAALAKAGPPPVATPKPIKPLPSVIPKPGDLRNRTILGMTPLKRPPKLEATPAPIAMTQMARDVEMKLPPPPRPARPTPDLDDQPTGVAAKFTPDTAFPDEASWDEAASHVLGETRVKGSDVILPANPLGGVESESLDAFVECTLYEETGSFAVDTEATQPGGEPDDWAKDDLTIPPWLQGPAPEGLPPTDSIAVPPPPLPLEPPPRPPTDRQSKGDLRAHLVDAGKAFDPARVPASEPILRVRSRRHWPLTAVIAAAAGLGGVAIGYFALGGSSDRDSEQAAPADPPAVARAAEPAPSPRPSDVVAATPAAPEPAAPAVEPPAPDEKNERGEKADTEPPAENEPPAEAKPAEPSTTPVEFAKLSGKLAADRCGAEIKGKPDDAQVFIGETRLGEVPLRVVVPCGEQTFVLRRSRYADLTKTVELESGKLEKLDAQMTRPEHRLRVTSVPSGAKVLVNGRPAGITPATVTVSGFETARIGVTMDGYKSWSGKVYVREATTNVSAKLSADKAAQPKPAARPGKSTARRGD